MKLSCSSEQSKSATLIVIINQYVLPGSIVITDGWKGYSSLNQHGFEHITVNHSLHWKILILGPIQILSRVSGMGLSTKLDREIEPKKLSHILAFSSGEDYIEMNFGCLFCIHYDSITNFKGILHFSC